MNPDRWTFRWLLIVPFLVGMVISHNWKIVLPIDHSTRIPTSKVRYMATEKEPIKVAQFLSTAQPTGNSQHDQVADPRLNESLALGIISDLDPLYGLMSLQL